jgi:hypothetical protein
LVVKPAPRDFIESFVGGADYWANNIRKEFRTTNPDQIAFCDTFKALLIELMAYVKEHHATGVQWNPKGFLPASHPTLISLIPSLIYLNPLSRPSSIHYSFLNCSIKIFISLFYLI